MKSTTLTVEVAIENEYVRALVLGELWAQIGSRITDFDAYAPTACDLLCGDQGTAATGRSGERSTGWRA